MNIVRIGTRQSQLALWQANYVRDALLRHHPGIEVELVGITSQGDKTLDVPLSQVGGKGLFLKELEEALLDGRVDLAVHSMKDVTVTLPDGLHIPVICEREDPTDALVSNQVDRLADLPHGAIVGSCSLRRRCILKNAYPHLEVKNLRGNVNTRLRRLDEGDYDALILASAGLKRLLMPQRIRQQLSVDEFLPAVGQGAVGIECRVEDQRINELIAVLDHGPTHTRVTAERSANEALEGGCHVPLAVHAELDGNELRVRGLVGEPDGGRVLHGELRGGAADADSLGRALAADLIAQGADRILQQVYGAS